MKKQLKFLPLALILSLLIGLIPLVALAAESDTVNVLEGKTFTAADRATATHAGSYNGESMNYDYTKLTDNDMHLHTGRFSTKSSDATQVFDGIVDLKGVYALGELQIYDFNPSSTAAAYMGTALEIQVYAGGEWTTAISCASNDEILAHRVGTSYLSFDLSGVTAEKIRIYMPGRIGSNTISIYEIKCFGTLVSIADVFEGKTFEAGELATPFFVGTHSGVSVNYDYTKLTDNNTHYQTGRFSTKSSDASQVFDGIIDLGGGYFLGELKINDFNSTATTAPFMGTALEIQVYSYGVWTTVVKCESNEEIVAHRLDSTYLSFDLGGVRADKVRIYIPARLGTNSISINEIECSATIDTNSREFYENLLSGKAFVPTEAAAKEVHVDPTCDYGYAVITDGSYLPKGGRFSTISHSETQQVDATVNLDGLYDLGELRIYDFNAQAEPNQSNPGYLGPNLTIEAYADGEWSTVLYYTREEYAAFRVVPSAAWGAQYLAFDLSGVKAEMLRIYIPSNIEGNSISFYEITCSGYKIADHGAHSGAEAVTENNVLPTCSSTGSYDSVVYCIVCGEEISRTTVTVDKLAHSYDSTVTAPTCTENGYTTYTCSACGDSYTADETTASGHNAVTVAGKDATCTESGLTDGAKCSVCGETLIAQEDIPATGHSYDATVTAPDCTNGGYTTYTCTVCGYSYVGDNTEALGHNYNADVTAPDCVSGGYTTYTCTACGYSYVGDNTEALGHNYNADVTAPDCTNGGYTTYTCSVCGDSYVGDETPALGHTEETVAGKAATCTESGLTDGAKCSVCGETLTAREEIPALGHSYNATVTAPDCTNGGYTTYTCSVCGDSYVGDETPALGHTEETVAGKAATCTESGLTDGAKCSVCGETLTTQEEIPALGHTYEVDIKAPTCTEDGYITHTCHCGDSYVELNADALGHDFAEATTEAPKTCKVCGETEGEKLPEPTPDPAPEKDHSKCETSDMLERIINMIINFFRGLFGLPEKCICGDEL